MQYAVRDPRRGQGLLRADENRSAAILSGLSYGKTPYISQRENSVQKNLRSLQKKHGRAVSGRIIFYRLLP